MSEFKLRNLERLTDKDHVLEVGDIVTHVNADGRFVIVGTELDEGPDSLYTLIGIDGCGLMSHIWADELTFTGDHVDIAEMLSQYR